MSRRQQISFMMSDICSPIKGSILYSTFFNAYFFILLHLVMDIDKFFIKIISHFNQSDFCLSSLNTRLKWKYNFCSKKKYHLKILDNQINLKYFRFGWGYLFIYFKKRLNFSDLRRKFLALKLIYHTKSDSDW
jgi:hypothetical protein